MSLLDKISQRWGNSNGWQDGLHKSAAHRALNMPEEPMIQANKTGIGALGAVGIALAAGLPAAALGLAMLLHKQPEAKQDDKTQPPASESSDTSLRVKAIPGE